ncbi:MAG: hypothetical protein HKN79_03725 [Flavobacteriales bacterium]|nr:hypothetical protein [Flavobacteriales bacterium]
MTYLFKIGEEVSFIHESGKGEVTSIRPDGMIIVLTEDGFETPYPSSVLVPRYDLQESRPEPEPIVEGPITEMKGLRLGTSVHILDQEDSGMILKFYSDETADVEFEDLFVKRLPITDLFVYDQRKTKVIEDSIESASLMDIGEESTYKNPQQAIKDRKDSGVWEVDLHIQELIDNSHGMMKHEIVQLQLDHFQGKLDEAIDKGLKKVIFIHGRGEGRLRNAIREILTRYPNCEFLDADYKRYGVGATEVRIKYRPVEN